MRGVDLKKRLNRKLVTYGRKPQIVFATNSYGLCDKETNSFVLICGGTEKRGGLWVEEILLTLKMAVRGSEESQEYAVLQYVEVRRPGHIVEETIECARLRLRTDDEENNMPDKSQAICEN